MVKLEVCVDTLESALAAAEGGASRLELCTGLDLGGLTPSTGLIGSVIDTTQVPVHVLIRPRAGDFCYSPQELAIMETDIEQARSLGAAGVVFGVLTPVGAVDVKSMRRLILAAHDMKVTCHRAFDLTADAFEALGTLLDIGVHYLLTSGQAATAVEGIGLLRELVERSGDRLTVMPGGGIDSTNAGLLTGETGAVWLHASARSSYAGPMSFRREAVTMGRAGQDEYSRSRTDAGKVRSIILAAQSVRRVLP
ncbi:MAG TPA: copper homeostasis protein CutC [Bacillota bacterium]|nr:copper homeostasis protein CutC [Bacillota bacterium]